MSHGNDTCRAATGVSQKARLRLSESRTDIQPIEGHVVCDDDKEPNPRLRVMQRGDRWGLIRPEEEKRGNACGKDVGCQSREESEDKIIKSILPRSVPPPFCPFSLFSFFCQTFHVLALTCQILVLIGANKRRPTANKGSVIDIDSCSTSNGKSLF